MLKKKIWKNFLKKSWKKILEKNLRARNISIATKSEEKSFKFFFVLVVLPKIKLWKNENFETNFIMSKAPFRVAQRKQNKKILFFLKKVLGHVNHVLNKIPSFENKHLFEIFTLAMIFFLLLKMLSI